jgi:hypothetical protein
MLFSVRFAPVIATMVCVAAPAEQEFPPPQGRVVVAVSGMSGPERHDFVKDGAHYNAEAYADALQRMSTKLKEYLPNECGSCVIRAAARLRVKIRIQASALCFICGSKCATISRIRAG